MVKVTGNGVPGRVGQGRVAFLLKLSVSMLPRVPQNMCDLAKGRALIWLGAIFASTMQFFVPAYAASCSEYFDKHSLNAEPLSQWQKFYISWDGGPLTDCGVDDVTANFKCLGKSFYDRANYVYDQSGKAWEIDYTPSYEYDCLRNSDGSYTDVRLTISRGAVKNTSIQIMKVSKEFTKYAILRPNF